MRLCLVAILSTLALEAFACLPFNAHCNPNDNKCCGNMACIQQGGEFKHHCHHCVEAGGKCDKGQKCCYNMGCTYHNRDTFVTCG
ncbi:unnamed protein product [Cercospora beticola]|nr:unnamed protein product [Cercospora beticola]